MYAGPRACGPNALPVDLVTEAAANRLMARAEVWYFGRTIVLARRGAAVVVAVADLAVAGDRRLRDRGSDDGGRRAA